MLFSDEQVVLVRSCHIHSHLASFIIRLNSIQPFPLFLHYLLGVISRLHDILDVLIVSFPDLVVHVIYLPSR